MNKYILFLFIALIFAISNINSQWFIQTSGTPNNLSSVYFINENTGWAVGDIGTIRYTTNGGINWVAQSGPSALLSVYFEGPRKQKAVVKPLSQILAEMPPPPKKPVVRATPAGPKAKPTPRG